MRIGDRYELLDAIGQGGMGTVWRAHDELLGRDVAIKEVLLPPELGEDERAERHARTIREARSAARLSHPGVITVHDVIEDEGRPWIVMELVSAPSLQSVIDADGPMAPQRVAELGRQMLAALRAAHAAGIVHRDIKPSNVLVADDRVVVTDFGIAALEGDATLTGTGVLIGSPAYISPERARGAHAGPAADLWSLGATLYAAVEGRSPFERSGPVSTLAAIMAEEAPPPHHAGPLAPVITGLLRRDPADRMTAVEADRMLTQALTGTRADLVAWTAIEPRPETGPPTQADAGTGPRTDAPSADPRWNAETRTWAGRPGAATGTGPDTLTAPRPASRRPVVMALACGLAGALVVVAFGAVWLLGRHSGSGTPVADSSTAPHVAVTTGGPAAGPANVPAGPTQSPATPPVQSPAGGAAPTTSDSAPLSWSSRSEDGFTVSVPSTWSRRSGGDNVFYEDASTRYMLQIGTTSWDAADPVSQAQVVAAGISRSFRGYRESTITPTSYLGVDAADLRFAYDRSTGTERVIDRFVQVDGHTFAIYFRMPAERWQDSPRYLDPIFAGFHPT